MASEARYGNSAALAAASTLKGTTLRPYPFDGWGKR
jgi:hypothetical protein